MNEDERQVFHVFLGACSIALVLFLGLQLAAYVVGVILVLGLILVHMKLSGMNLGPLENLVQRLLILGSDEEIGFDEVEAALGSEEHVAAASLASSLYDLPLREARERFEREYLQHQLQACGGSVQKLAKLAGMERTHLYRKLRSLDIDPKHLGSDK